MRIASLIELSSTPNISSILGTQGSRRVIESINNTSGGVFFGSAQDPFANNYQNFKNIYARSERVHEELMQSQFFIVGMNEIVPIINEDSLVAIPPIMQVPIMTYEPIRHYYNAGVIEGWGLDIPEEVEDTAGRLINNGLIRPEFDAEGNWTVADEIVWEYQQGDPEYTNEELDALDDTRRFFAQFIMCELGPGKDRRDPTGKDGFGTIGKLK